MLDVQRLYEWMVDGAPGAPSSVAVVARMAPDLVAAGVPLDRLETFVRTLHPHIAGRSFEWLPGRDVAVVERSYAFFNSPAFLRSPEAQVARTGEARRLRASDPDERTLLQGITGDGFTECLVAPLRFLSGQVHPMTLATRAPGGFTAEHVETMLHVLRPLTRIAEILALSRTTANLLNTYVGHNAGERILSGSIVRGDNEMLRAVIWFSDLRGFTTLSSTQTAPAILQILNDLFDCQVTAIEKRGGEVLKFMGDGLLAIFPAEDSKEARCAACNLALEAAAEAFASLATLNQSRAASGAVQIQFGVGLHAGDLYYGNIGGAARLDFTCIGPAVNLASRIEGLTSKLGQPLLMSEKVASHTTHPVRSVGSFALKGVPDEQEVFAPAGG